MVQELFSLHPEIVTWFEPRTIWVYAAPAREHDRFDASDATPRVTRYIRRRFLRYQRKHGDRRIMEKTPSNLMRIPYVDAIFPESRYLYLVREPLANISSSELRWQEPVHLRRVSQRLLESPKTQLHYYLKRYAVDHFRVRVLKRKHVSIWGVRYPGIQRDLKSMSVEEVIARQWAACSRQAEQDLASIEPDRVLRLRYEDFVEDPQSNFRRISEHVQINLTPEIEAALRERIDPGRQQKWKRLDRTVIERCLPHLVDEMRRHGYDEARLYDPR